MNKRIKELWLKALRSGEYRQARKKMFIRTKSGRESFCCLGVLTNECDAWGEYAEDRKANGFIVVSVSEINKLDTLRGAFTPERCRLSESDKLFLARVNDSGWSFEMIADWIEGNL